MSQQGGPNGPPPPPPPQQGPPPFPQQGPPPVPQQGPPPYPQQGPPPMQQQGPPPVPQQGPPPMPQRMTGSSHGAQPGPPSIPGPPAMPDPGPLTDPGPIDGAILYSTELTRSYPCRACGAALLFDPGTQQLRCPACATMQPLVDEGGRIVTHDLGETMQALAQLSAAAPATLDKEIVCQACGGRTSFVGSQTALRCPYCNTPIQRDDLQNAPARLPIDAVLPFQVPEQQARQQIEQWINSRWFAPNEFKKYRTLGSFTSTYLAYYSYDVDTTTMYRGQRGIHRTETYESNGETRTRTVTDWYPVSGVVTNDIDALSTFANRGIDEAKVQQLEPWPRQQVVPYSPQYVAGHLSRTYDLDANQAFGERAVPRVEEAVDQTIRNDIGGNEQRIDHRSINYDMIRFVHLLMPVWLLVVTYDSKPFQVLINGVTGEVQGERPWSAIKITIAVILAVIAIVVIVMLYRAFGG